MTYDVRPWESGHTRSCSTSAQRCRNARSQASPGDGRHSEFRQIVTKSENGKEAGSLELRDGPQGHVSLCKGIEEACATQDKKGVASPQDDKQFAATRRSQK